MSYKAIIQAYAAETTQLLEAKAQQRQLFLDHALPIDVKLRELVADQELLRFLQARDHGFRGYSADLYRATSGTAGFTSVSINPRGEIILGSNEFEGSAVYQLKTNVGAEGVANNTHLKSFEEFVSEDGSAFVCVVGVPHEISVGDMLAARYNRYHFERVTPETMEQTLTDNLETIAKRSR